MIAATSSPQSGFGGPVGFGEVALALLLVAVALAVSRWRQVGLESDLTVATVRSFVQLLAVGYALDFVFRGHGGFTVVVLAVMIATATLTSGGRAAGVPGARPIAAASISGGRPRPRWACCSHCGIVADDVPGRRSRSGR